MSNKAILYRMVTSEHICPFGIKSKDLLRREGFDIEDNHLKDRDETDQFKERYEVETTPQTFIQGEKIGGYDDLRRYFGKSQEGSEGTTYTPVLMVFALAALLVGALTFAGKLDVNPETLIMQFVAVSMVMLALQKLKDLTAFSYQFITYDLLAMRYVRYAYIYPFAEAYAGLGMIAALPAIAVAPVSLFIGLIGAVSVIKAVYIDKRELKCACVGGDSNVPLGAISLSENAFMVLAGAWMMVRTYLL